MHYNTAHSPKDYINNTLNKGLIFNFSLNRKKNKIFSLSASSFAEEVTGLFVCQGKRKEEEKKTTRENYLT